MDEEIKKNIKKCSRCALCAQNCPIFAITKDENNTARGLICKLFGYGEGQLTKKEIKHDLKICLMCSKCKNNCPSKVDTTKVFSYKNAYLYPSKISQRVFLGLKLLPIKIFYFLNFFKFENKKAPKTNILYFKGCLARAQHKTTFLDALFYAPEFSCCGLPYLGGGDIKNYKKVKEKNIELIKNAKKVVFDCASCKSAVMDYPELSEKDKQKLIFFSELDLKNKLKKNSKYKNKTVVFHKPCHLDKEDFLKIENYLKSIEGINYKPLDDPDNCCGFGGSYFIYHPLVALKIALKKARTIKQSKADLILTACPSCTLGLRSAQLLTFNFKKTLELRDFIDKEII